MADNNKTKEFSRRDFLKTSGAVTGGFIGGSLLGGLVGFNLEGITEEELQTNTDQQGENNESNLSNNNDSHFEARAFFKRKEDFEVLSAATEIIFPEDELGPGAIGLGVPYFIDRQLATPWGLNVMDYMKPPFHENETPINRQDIFISGLRALNDASHNEFDNSFIEIDDEQKVKILEQCENDELEMKYINSSIFFSALRISTLEGAYADPLYGGNKNMEGWRMKEYPGAQLSYRNMMEEDSSGDEEFVLIEPISLSQQ